MIGARIAAVYDLQAEYLEPRLEALCVSWTTFLLLTAISNAGEEASQIEVARRLGVTAATLSESVQNHVAKGLIRQTNSKKDGRVKVLVLTAKTTRVLQKIRDLVVASEETMTRGLLPHELSAACIVLDRIEQNFESALDLENPPPS